MKYKLTKAEQETVINFDNELDTALSLIHIYSEEDNPIALKADFILSLCELIVGGKEALQPVEKTVIDRCVHQLSLIHI